MADIVNILQTIVTIALLLIGTLLLLTAAIGIVRMPDLYTRMSAASKASSLGAICILLGVGIGMADTSVTVRVFAGVVFLLITTPVSAHMIGRAAYMLGVPLWAGAHVDELRGHYDRRRHTLSAGDERPLPDSDSSVMEEVMH